MIQNLGSIVKDNKSSMMSQFIPGTEQYAPEAIHIDNSRKKSSLETIINDRPPSSGS